MVLRKNIIGDFMVITSRNFRDIDTYGNTKLIYYESAVYRIINDNYEIIEKVESKNELIAAATHERLLDSFRLYEESAK